MNKRTVAKEDWRPSSEDREFLRARRSEGRRNSDDLELTWNDYSGVSDVIEETKPRPLAVYVRDYLLTDRLSR